MKYYLFLLINCLLIYGIIMFFVDNQFFPAATMPKIRNGILVILFITIGYNLVSIYVLKKAAPETGLVYKTVSAVRNGAASFATFIQPYKRELIIYSLVAAGLIIAGLLLVGMPGYLIMAAPVKLGICSAITGDAAWPAAILLSILWPLCLPAGILLKTWLYNHGYTSFAAAGPVLTLVTGIPLLTTLVYAMSK